VGLPLESFLGSLGGVWSLFDFLGSVMFGVVFGVVYFGCGFGFGFGRV